MDEERETPEAPQLTGRRAMLGYSAAGGLAVAASLLGVPDIVNRCRCRADRRQDDAAEWQGAPHRDGAERGRQVIHRQRWTGRCRRPVERHTRSAARRRGRE